MCLRRGSCLSEEAGAQSGDISRKRLDWGDKRTLGGWCSPDGSRILGSWSLGQGQEPFSANPGIFVNATYLGDGERCAGSWCWVRGCRVAKSGAAPCVPRSSGATQKSPPRLAGAVQYRLHHVSGPRLTTYANLRRPRVRFIHHLTECRSEIFHTNCSLVTQ